MLNSAFLYYIETKKIYNCFSFYSDAMVASGCSCVFENVPARVRKNKNTHSSFSIFNIGVTFWCNKVINLTLQ